MKTTKKNRVIYTLKNQNPSHQTDYFASEIDLSVLILFVIGEYDEERVAPLDRRGSPEGEVTSLRCARLTYDSLSAARTHHVMLDLTSTNCTVNFASCS